VVPLEFLGDRFDEGIVLEAVLDPQPDRLDELEELVGFHVVLADEENVGEHVVVALVELKEMHRSSIGCRQG
jgi:hypothetical protein